MHTAWDDSLLATIRFVSRHEDTQVYGAILPKSMMNQSLLESVAYKTYYVIVSGAEPPKLKKPKTKADPTISSKETPSKKKPTKAKKDADRGKGLNVLSEVALSGAAQLKEATKQSKKDFISLKLVAQVMELIFNLRFLMSNNTRSLVQMKELVLNQGFSMYPSDEGNDDGDDSDGNDDDNDDDDNDDDEENKEESDDGEELYKDVNVNLRKEDVEMNNNDQEKLLNFKNVSLADNGIASLMDTIICTEEPSAIVDRYMDNKLGEAINKAIQSHNAECREKAQAKKQDYIDLVDSSVRTIIKKEVKTQLPQILPKADSDFATPMIERNVNESLEVVVLARSSSQPKSTYEAVASLSEYELTKILLDKIKESKSHLRADYKRKLYDALVESYNTNKDIFNTYGEVLTLKRSRDDKDKDQDLSAGSDRGTKRRKSSKEADVTTHAEKPPTSFNELMDTPIDFSAFVMNRLNITNPTQELLVGLAFNLLKGTCKSFTELKYHFEECSKATTERLDWHNPEGKLTMTTTVAQQVAIDNDLAPLEKRVEIGKIPSQEFDEPPTKEEALPFIRELGHSREIKYIIDIDNKDTKKQDKMFYPRFTKIIIHHLLERDKSISMRNKTFMHTAWDDSLLATIRFVSRHEDTQVYGAILPKSMMNQSLLESVAYKTYYAIVSGAEPPKLKKPKTKADPTISSKENPSKKKPTKAKKDVPSKVPDEQQHKISGIDEGTGDEGNDDGDDSDGNDDDNDDDDNDGNDDDDSDQQVDQYTQAISSIPAIVDRYMDNKLGEAINKAIQSHNAECREKAQAEKQEYIDLVDSSVRTIIKKEVKTQLPQILPKADSDFVTPVIERNVKESLEVVVLARSSSQPKSTYEAVASLSEYELTKILLDKIKESKSHLRADYKRKLYDALVESYNTNKDLFNTYGEVFTLKMSRDDKDKDQDLSARSDRGTKRRKSSKEAESQNDSRSKEGKSSSSSKDTSCSHHKSSGKSAHAEEPSHTVDDSRISVTTHAEKPPTSFNELMDTPIDFFAFVMNRLNITNPTQELLVGLAFNLLKVTRLKIMKKYDYDHLDEIEVRREHQQPYTFKEDIDGHVEGEHFEWFKDENNTERPTMFVITWSYNVVRISYSFLRSNQNQRDLPRDIPLVSVEVRRHEIKRSKSENKGKVPTEMELVLEQTQQGESAKTSALGAAAS
nr:hypothetical protein [Tanacetum cinerariifolium]